MAQADRLKAGAAMISANNLNKVIEQSNRLDLVGGGPGIDAQNDPTGFHVRNNRRRERADGDTSYDSSSPIRRTLKRRTDETRHRGEWELFNSSVVGRWAISSSIAEPPRYGIPYLLTSSDGDGDLGWMRNDADAFGSSGPRSIQRRVSGSGEFQQLYRFNEPTATLDSSEVVQVAVRRRYGSSGNWYLDWVLPPDASVDENSVDRNGSGNDEDIQLYKWDEAGSTGISSLVGADRFPVWDESANLPKLLKYATVYQMTDYAANVIRSNITDYVDLDGHSIDTNADDEVQLAGWETAASRMTAVPPDSLIPYKPDGENVLNYSTIGEIILGEGGVGAFGGWDLAGDYLKCYGKSIGYFEIGETAPVRAIGLDTRYLENGVWRVTDDTVASNSGGCLELIGGLFSNKGAHMTAAAPNGGNIAQICIGGTYTLDATKAINSDVSYHQNGTQVVGAQQSGVGVAIPSTSGTDNDGASRTRINEIMVALRTHGLIS